MAEQKASPQYTKAVKDRTVTGIFSVFGVLDNYNDVIHPGAFTKTLQERGKKIVHLWLHDMQSPPIAKIVSLRELRRDELPTEILRDYPEATGGVEVVREYLETPRGEEVLVAIKTGVPLEMSFAFDPVKYDFEEFEETSKAEHERQRNLREVRLYETSDVLWGANPATTAVSKSDILHECRSLLDRLHEQRAGSRHSAADIELINQIAKNAIELGATNAQIKEIIEDLEDVIDDNDKKSQARAQSRRAYLEWQERRAALRELGVFV